MARGLACPFLHKVAAEVGGSGGGDDAIDDEWAASGGVAFEAVHGSAGILPLGLDAGTKGHQRRRPSRHETADEQRQRRVCARDDCPPRDSPHGAASLSSSGTTNDDDDHADGASATAPPSISAWTFRRLLSRSVASISFSGMGSPPGFGAPEHPPSKGGADKNEAKRNAARDSKSQQQLRTTAKSSADAVESFKQSKCPLASVPGFHKVLASILSIADSAKRGPGFKLECPAPIVAMRALLSAMPQVRALRPKPLAEKLAAVAAASFMCNLPLGVWREHTDKFSFAWFVAVHASIPFVVSLRKAVMLPRMAIIVTIASAVLGQYVASRFERRRIAAPGISDTVAVVGIGGAVSAMDDACTDVAGGGYAGAAGMRGAMDEADDVGPAAVRSGCTGAKEGSRARTRAREVGGFNTRDDDGADDDLPQERGGNGRQRKFRKSLPWLGGSGGGGGGGGGVDGGVGLPGLPTLRGMSPPQHSEVATTTLGMYSSEKRGSQRDVSFTVEE
mmetsp:Transcript_30010/g.75158  ORF Transcript_30010/g.75158 Transcript_30010/m.75158 type:complete len:505 (-) Transcript_30010:206-1720(-)|eukprot:CAMPEP_0181381464 /NCGR_PEP_ID=MMETSP1106-20121128/20140_1 /TAXON_ID=81844 /ORGANISM="Mantoniella antarctica, Strain SL-175" /LENGTH=504 /DNA_ID=CAMNT_0023500659 /DNA_START=223 /DNA_END=1737 /DNA_ORIENTATION=+